MALNNIETNKINKKQSNSHDMLHIDQWRAWRAFRFHTAILLVVLFNAGNESVPALGKLRFLLNTNLFGENLLMFFKEKTIAPWTLG